MPTYEYVCTDCQNQWEEVQKISDTPLDVCPKCGKSTAKRQISGGNFILKGGGWYADLYSSTKKSDASASASSSSTTTTKTESSAPAAKSDSPAAGSGSGSSGSSAPG